jgi:hypothetical protein
MLRPTAGKWILPQPPAATESGEYVSIPRLSKIYVPFGYKVNELDDAVLDPIDVELEALEQAKKYLKQYPSRYVAAWLTKVTGRSISHTGLLKRLKNEQRHKAKAASLRSWAARYKRAIEEAEKYEKRTGNKYVKNAREIIDQVDRDHGIDE